MSRALVLNASYEPLCVVADRRAVVLVLSEKADLLSDSGRALHAERLVVPVPSVIRLRYFVRVPFDRGVALSRRAVFARDDHLCQYCGSGAESIDDDSNLCAALWMVITNQLWFAHCDKLHVIMLSALRCSINCPRWTRRCKLPLNG